MAKKIGRMSLEEAKMSLEEVEEIERMSAEEIEEEISFIKMCVGIDKSLLKNYKPESNIEEEMASIQKDLERDQEVLKWLKRLKSEKENFKSCHPLCY